VLLLGEGNFSLAAAFCRRHVQQTSGDGVRVVATSLETADEARSVWGAGPALDELSERSNVDVVHGVDATALEQSPLRGEAFDAVLWTFPHVGKKGRIHLNRALLSGFARSLQSAAVLREPSGHVEVSLAAGQGGTPADGASRRRFYGDSWQLALNAAEGGFLITDAEDFNLEAWAALGYRSAGHYRGLGAQLPTMDKAFRAAAGVVHTLVPEGRPGALARWPEVFELHGSFWVSDTLWLPSLSEAAQLHSTGVAAPQAFAHAVRDAARTAVGKHLADVDVVNLWLRPVDGRLSICLRFTYSAPELAMTHARARLMHEAVKECVQRCMPGVAVRTRADSLPDAAMMS
jgi:Domain of unknown function (DUF2431)